MGSLENFRLPKARTVARMGVIYSAISGIMENKMETTIVSWGYIRKSGK